MKNVNTFVIVCISVLVLSSCSKKTDDNNNGNSQNTILRTWNFISMDVKHELIEERNEGFSKWRTVTKTEYVTIKNGGTATFDSDKITSENLAYEVNAVEKSYYYRNDSLLKTEEAPLRFTVLHSGLLSDYTMTGTDSLQMNSGPIKIKPNATSQPVTIKLQFENDKVYLVYKILRKYIPNSTVTETETANVLITLQKK
ncbi:MAG: hypothetical protein H7122_15975 [Chitinophagaceae bacterium]|nr:hypothetical protein [Chitinophagaceae bacterium]